MAHTDSPVLERVIDFINNLDDRLEEARARYGEFIPPEYEAVIAVVDDSLDRLVEVLTPFAEEQPIRAFFRRISERVQARRARRQEQRQPQPEPAPEA